MNNKFRSMFHGEDFRGFSRVIPDQRNAFRVATIMLNIASFDDVAGTQRWDSFVTWDALEDVLPYMATAETERDEGNADFVELFFN